MTDATRKPETLTIRQEKPDIRHLPVDVGSRIEDMWRVGGMLSRFVERSHAAKRRQELIGDACALATQTALSSPLNGEAAQTLLSGMDSIQIQSLALNREKPEGEAWVTGWVGVTYEQGHRLSCEAELLFFHSALDYLPDADKSVVEQFPLFHCLRRSRNIAAHYRIAEVTEADFHARASNRMSPDEAVVNLNFIGSWFLVVDPKHLLATKGGSPHADLFAWFKRICDTHPLWWVLQAAVAQLCDYYKRQSSRAG